MLYTPLGVFTSASNNMSLLEYYYYYLRRRLASGEGIVSLGFHAVCVCPPH